MIDRKKFFEVIRDELFRGALSQETVSGCNAILDEWERRGLTDLRWLAYMLATVRGECGPNMLPVREGFAKSDAAARAHVRENKREYAKEIRGHVYYGRGLVQLTWERNYQEMSKLLGIDLLNKPDLALEPANAAKIMFEGMIRGIFTGKKLADFFNTKSDWTMARSIVNGKRRGESLPDKAAKFASWGQAFHKALVAAEVEPAPEPEPDDDDVVVAPDGKKKKGMLAALGALGASLMAFAEQYPTEAAIIAAVLVILFILVVKRK